MSNTPIQSGEFNQAMDGIRQTISVAFQQFERRFDTIGGEISDLKRLHQEDVQRQLEAARQEGVRVGEANALERRVVTIEESHKTQSGFRRTIATGVIVSTAASIIAIVFTVFRKGIGLD